MNNLAIRYAFDRKREASETKTGLLQIEVRVEKTSQKTFISTGIKLYKSQFSDKNGFTCKNHPNALLIINKARKIFNEVEAFCLSDKCKELADVKNWNKKDTPPPLSVKSFINAELTRTDPSYDVIEYHRSLFCYLSKKISKKQYYSLYDRWLRLLSKCAGGKSKRHLKTGISV